MAKSKEEIALEKREAEITAECEAIAKKHDLKRVFRIASYNLDGEECISYHKLPSRKDCGAALSITNEVLAKDIQIRSTFVEGDKRVFEDDEFFYSACTKIGEIFTVRVADLKKNY